MGRPPCCDKSNVKRGLWTPEEDAKILAYVSDHGTGNWTLVPKKAGLNRCGKSCRLRWTNYLRPDLKHDGFTPEEEEHIINLHKAIGSRWSLIAKQLPGRTDNDVKNYWNTKLRKKLLKMGIDPITHKPFSQIFTDFGNVSGFGNNDPGNHFGRRNIHNNNNNNNNNMVLMSKSEPSTILLNKNSSNNNNVIINPRTGFVQENSNLYSNPSWEFLPQFQVPNQEIIIQPNPNLFSDQVSSSCSSPSSSTITQRSSTVQQQSQIITTPSSPFSWSEFLLCDPISSPDFPQEPDNDQGMFSSTNSLTLAENETTVCQINSTNEKKFDNNIGSDDQAINNTNAEASSSSGSSFVDAILCQDSEMSSKLFELLDTSFD
ncbi:hypothetical protein LWI28_015172 [Acer negundo]|uniref:MYB transcription factor n=1 Tax=Acer negundo TaxID=4023 RepID=A0AAD5I906_ACENE|nr:hypothetical protein LWI28_015172 [Acer negundo]KAK4833648.1 hypothetical protein QYF36_008794 [Acer negundo]